MSEDATHSRCTSCDTDNVPLNVHGAPGSDKQNWATFVCGGAGPGSGADGCGQNYSVTTKAGLEHNTRMGTRTLGKVTDDASSGRTTSSGSDLFRSNYAAIFGHD